MTDPVIVLLCANWDLLSLTLCLKQTNYLFKLFSYRIVAFIFTLFAFYLELNRERPTLKLFCHSHDRSFLGPHKEKCNRLSALQEKKEQQKAKIASVSQHTAWPVVRLHILLGEYKMFMCCPLGDEMH